MQVLKVHDAPVLKVAIHLRIDLDALENREHVHCQYLLAVHDILVDDR